MSVKGISGMGKLPIEPVSIDHEHYFALGNICLFVGWFYKFMYAYDQSSRSLQQPPPAASSSLHPPMSAGVRECLGRDGGGYSGAEWRPVQDAAPVSAVSVWVSCVVPPPDSAALRISPALPVVQQWLTWSQLHSHNSSLQRTQLLPHCHNTSLQRPQL